MQLKLLWILLLLNTPLFLKAEKTFVSSIENKSDVTIEAVAYRWNPPGEPKQIYIKPGQTKQMGVTLSTKKEDVPRDQILFRFPHDRRLLLIYLPNEASPKGVNLIINPNRAISEIPVITIPSKEEVSD